MADDQQPELESALLGLRLGGGGEHDDAGTTTLSAAFERAERLALAALGKPASMASSASLQPERQQKAPATTTVHAGSDSDADSDAGADADADGGGAAPSAAASAPSNNHQNLPPDAAALAAIAAAHRAADAANLFSRNEDADDVPTSSLRFLLLPALRGLVLANARMMAPPPPPSQERGGSGNGPPNQNHNPMAARMRQVAASEAALSDFLARVNQYGMFGSEALARDYKRDEEAAALAARARGGQGASSSAAASSSSSGPPAPLPGVLPAPPDLAAARTAKMARFRRGRELERHVETLTAARRAALAAGAGGADGARRRPGGDDDGDRPRASGGAGAGTWDEADERTYWAARLEQAALEALDQRASLRQERALLEHALGRQQQQEGGGGSGNGSAALRSRREAQWQQERQRDREVITSKLGVIADALAGANGGRGRVPTGASAAAAAAALGRGGTGDPIPASALAALRASGGVAGASAARVDGSDRERLRDRALFTPYHNPATITIEEAGEQELREAQRLERRAADAEEQRRRQKAQRGAYCDEDVAEDDDEAVAKARAWDDWKDTHPFGYGNSQTNPCPPGQLKPEPPRRLKKY
jgi:hypothetical protein